MRTTISLVLWCFLTALASQLAAQPFPAKPIRIIVPFPAGGTSDILTRLIGAKLTESWGQQVLPDNRPGANSNIGTGKNTAGSGGQTANGNRPHHPAA